MNRCSRALWLLAIVALVFAPLRASFPVPLPGAADGTAHCMSESHGVHSGEHDHAKPGSPGHGLHQDCEPDCQGLCCGGACAACAHAVLALPVSFPDAQPSRRNLLNAAQRPRQEGRILHPPLRPPIELPA
jgi:hypothetical protein